MMKEKYARNWKNFFEISKDQASRERLRVLLKLFKEIDDKYPTLRLAFSLWGSLTKDKDLSDRRVARSTDVDLNIFFLKNEADRIFNNGEEILGMRKEHYIAGTDLAFELGLKIERYIIEELEKASKAMVFNIREGLRLTLVDDELINRFIKHGDLPVFLWPFFGYDIGGGLNGRGLRYYQKIILKRIAETGEEESEKIWLGIYKKSTNWFKGDSEIPEEIEGNLPNSFEKALKAYNVNI